MNTYANSQRLHELAKNYQPAVPYPNTGLAERLKLVAQLIEADLGARIFYVTLNGFDTHANQLTLHANLLKELSDSVASFFKDVSARGHRDRVLLMTFSEFGRRAKENQSQGTDHGSAAPMFLVGGRVKPGVIGRAPQPQRSGDGQAKAPHRFPPRLRRYPRTMARHRQPVRPRQPFRSAKNPQSLSRLVFPVPWLCHSETAINSGHTASLFAGACIGMLRGVRCSKIFAYRGHVSHRQLFRSVCPRPSNCVLVAPVRRVVGILSAVQHQSRPQRDDQPRHDVSDRAARTRRPRRF